MMLQPATSLNVVPGGGLVTKIALMDLCFELSSQRPRNQGEMHHAVAGRWLVTLGALSRPQGRMAEISNRPGIEGVTLCTTITEKLLVFILGGVASNTVEQLRIPAPSGVRGESRGLFVALNPWTLAA